MGGSGDRGEIGDKGASVSILTVVHIHVPSHSHSHTLLYSLLAVSREIWECKVLMEKKETWDQVEKRVTRYVMTWCSHCTSSIKHMLMHVP